MSERTMVRSGWVLTGLFAAFILAASAAPKLAGANVAINSIAALGWPASAVLPLGLLELTCLALYLFRPTAVLGAVLFTGLLGGAIATQIRVGNPLFSHVLFGLYLGLMMWGGLWLRTPALRALFPIRRDGGR